MRKRILVLLTAAALAVSSFPVSVCADTDINTDVIRDADDISATVTDEELVGTQSRADNFAGGYTITGNGEKDILSVAFCQEGRSGADLGYEENWCADFVADCALKAGQDKALPAHALVSAFRDNIIKAGGRVVSQAEAIPGDIVIYDWGDPPKKYNHVEIVYDNVGGIICSIGGNTGSKDFSIAIVDTHDTRYTTKHIVEIIRPNYSSINLSDTPTLSDQSEPDSLMKPGTAFNVCGTVSCKNSLSAIHVYVLDSNGNAVTGKSVYPNTHYYNLKSVDNDVKFSKLSIGSYEYKITAIVNDTEYVLLSKRFAVSDGTYVPTIAPTVTLKPTATSKPTPSPLPSGDCSKTPEDHIKWRVEKKEDGSYKLIISGAGRMCDSDWKHPLLKKIASKLSNYISEIEVCEGVLNIGRCSFGGTFEEYNIRVSRISLPKGLKEIGNCAFEGCRGIRDIVIPEGTTSIGDMAFYYDTNLESINIPESVETIGGAAFWCCGLRKINIPSGVTSIESNTFFECICLEEINIPDGVISIGESAFTGCASLKEIHLPMSVTSIGNSAFAMCDGLGEITIPEGVKKISVDVWYACRHLKTIRLPQSIETLVPGSNSKKIEGTALTDIYYNGTKREWDEIDKPSDADFIDETKITIHYLKTENPTTTLMPTCTSTPRPTAMTKPTELPKPTASPVSTATPMPTATPAATTIIGRIYGTGLSLKGKIGANILIGFTEVSAVEDYDPSIVINVEGKETELKLSEQEHYTSGNNEIYEIQAFVPAKQINDEIELKLMGKNGNDIGLKYGKKSMASFTFSINSIISSYLANPGRYDEKTIDLVKVIQNYCGYTQLMSGYKTDTAKITDKLTTISESDLKPYASVYDKNSKIAKYTGVGLALQSDTTMQIYFKLTDNVDAYTITLDGEAVTPEDCGSGLYCVELKSIPAGKLSTASEIVIRKGDETFTIKASALSWAESVLSNSKAQKQTTINMAKMIYRYAQKADNYFAKK